jgi:hypothetical protein
VFGYLKSGRRWNYEVLYAVGSNTTIKASNSKP